jgi:hypothetical protein
MFPMCTWSSRCHQLSQLALANKRTLYDLLFRASAATLLEIAANPKHLGTEIGFMSVLHTWGQNVLHHPHAHCVIPAGGLSLDHQRWIRPRYAFFLPVKVLSRVFRGKFYGWVEESPSEEISQGAHGTTCLAGILPESIKRRTTLWLTARRFDASSSVRPCSFSAFAS